VHALLGVVCHVLLYVCDARYVSVHLVEEKALSVCWLWQLIRCVYRKNKARNKDQ